MSFLPWVIEVGSITETQGLLVRLDWLAIKS